MRVFGRRYALASLARWGDFILIFRRNPPFARPIPADFFGKQTAVRSNFFHKRFDFIKLVKYFDKVYGQVEIDEPVVLALLESPVMKRLRGIDSAGYSQVYYGVKYHSRLEHSLGVFLLLRRFGASFEEQIAGLIHDVSHSAFSHTIDYVFAEGSQEAHAHQDNIFEEYVRNSKIPKILEKHGLNLEFILDDRNFLLKERELPDLCADRIDYSLRSALDFKQATAQETVSLIDDLITIDNHWVYKHLEKAKRHAELFFTLNKNFYASLTNAIMFRTLGDYLKYAIDQKYISKQDLYTTDEAVLQKISIYLEDDDRLKFLKDRLDRRTSAKNDPADYEAAVMCKSRIIDPLCLVKKQIMRLSQIDPVWGQIVKEELKPKKYFLNFERI